MPRLTIKNKIQSETDSDKPHEDHYNQGDDQVHFALHEDMETQQKLFAAT